MQIIFLGGFNAQAKRRFVYYTLVLQKFGVNEQPQESGCYN